MNDKELKIEDCPFCGSEAKVVDGYSDVGSWVECTVCKATCGAEEGSHEYIITKWNTRVEKTKTKLKPKCPSCGDETDWCLKCKKKFTRRNEWLDMGTYDG